MPLKPLKPGTKVKLKDDTATDDGEPRGKAADEALQPLIAKLVEQQVALYAEAKQSLLLVFQGRDASGKDGLTRKVFGPINSQGCTVTNFKKPSEYELARDFLWRVHQAVPPKGTIGIFNRSHYEDVLVVRVHGWIDEATVKRRFRQINDFERMLTENGVVILKFFLHISKDEQREQFLERLTDPTKNWKFRAGDLDDRALWGDYTRAYRDALRKCSTRWAPWYLVPSDHRTARNYLITKVINETLSALKPEYPRASKEVLALKGTLVR